MPEMPSAELLTLLDRLGLATADQVQGVRRRAKALARNLPLFDSVWVDALVQADLITPYQATQINAGRGDALAAGPFVLLHPRSELGYATLFDARRIESRRRASVLAAPLSRSSGEQAEDSPAVRRLQKQLADLVDLHRSLRHEAEDESPLVEQTGITAANAWAACGALAGLTVSDWLVRNGRFPPETVLEAARQMAATLAVYQRHGIIHGDIRAPCVFFGESGEVQLPLAGCRAVVRPSEGFSQCDAPPECFDCLAPERVEGGGPSDMKSDLYACGLLWWQMLAGRAALSGGDSLAKLKSALAGKLYDIRLLAPGTPDTLLRAIAACTRREPAERPESFAALASLLGPSTRTGRSELAGCALRRSPKQSQFAEVTSSLRRSRHLPVVLAGAAGCLLMIAAVLWPLWGPRARASLANVAIKWEPRPPKPAADYAGSNLRNTSHPANENSDAVEDDTADSTAALVLAADSRTNVLVLPSTSHRADALPLSPGQTIRSRAGKRVELLLPDEGWTIATEKLRFENIDFRLPPDVGNPEPSEALIRLTARECTFVGCTFRSSVARPRVAIACHYEAPPEREAALAPAAAVRLQQCVASNTNALIECRRAGPMLVELENVLHIGPPSPGRFKTDSWEGEALAEPPSTNVSARREPRPPSSETSNSSRLVRLVESPAVEDEFLLRMHRCTARRVNHCLEVVYPEVPDRPAKLRIESSDCVFALAERGGSLISFRGRENPQSWLSLVRWSGQGSLLQPDSRFARWFAESGGRPLSEENTIIDGLVASTFRFAGAAQDGVAGSALVDWAAPLQSEQPPGADVDLLPPHDTLSSIEKAFSFKKEAWEVSHFRQTDRASRQAQ